MLGDQENIHINRILTITLLVTLLPLRKKYLKPKTKGAVVYSASHFQSLISWFQGQNKMTGKLEAEVFDSLLEPTMKQFLPGFKIN